MVLRHVSILKDHPQGVFLYLAKVTELCVAWHHKGHNTHLLQYCCHNTGFNHRDFKFSVLNLKNSSNLLNNSVTLARYRQYSLRMIF